MRSYGYFTEGATDGLKEENIQYFIIEPSTISAYTLATEAVRKAKKRIEGSPQDMGNQEIFPAGFVLKPAASNPDDIVSACVLMVERTSAGQCRWQILSHKEAPTFLSRFFLLAELTYETLQAGGQDQEYTADPNSEYILLLDENYSDHGFLVSYTREVRGRIKAEHLTSGARHRIKTIFHVHDPSNGPRTLHFSKSVQPDTFFFLTQDEFYKASAFINRTATPTYPKHFSTGTSNYFSTRMDTLTLHRLAERVSADQHQKAKNRSNAHRKIAPSRQSPATPRSGRTGHPFRADGITPSDQLLFSSYDTDFPTVVELLKAHREIIGREYLKKRIQDIITTQESGYLLLTGPLGIGKTALMANLVNELKPSCAGQEVTYFFFERKSGVTEPKRCFHSLYLQYVKKHSHSLDISLSDAGDYAFALAKLLYEDARAAEDNPGIEAILVDAIDEAEDPSTILRLLPKELPKKTFIILSSRIPFQPHIHTLKGSVAIPMDPDSQDSYRDVLRYVENWRPHWSATTCEVVAQRAKGNFLILKKFFEFQPEDLPETEAIERFQWQATDPEDPLLSFYSWCWEEISTISRRWSEDSKRAMRDLSAVLGILTIGQAPLTQQQILRFLGEDWTYTDLEGCFKQVVAFLEVAPGDSEVSPQVVPSYRLFHESFRRFMERKLAPDLPRLHGRIVDTYCSNKSIASECLDEYGCKHLIRHAVSSDQPHRAFNLFTPDYFNYKLTALDSSKPLIKDLDLLIDLAQTEHNWPLLLKVGLLRVKCQDSAQEDFFFLRAILRLRMGEIQNAFDLLEYNAPPEEAILLRVKLAELCWNSRRVLGQELIRQIDSIRFPRCDERVEYSVLRLAELDPAAALCLALRMPRANQFVEPGSIRELPNRGRCLFALFRSIAQKDEQLALCLAKKIHDPLDRILSLLAVSQSLLTRASLLPYKTLAQALKEISGTPAYTCIAFMVRKQILDTFPSMSHTARLCALDKAADYITLHPFTLGFSPKIDSAICNDPALWIDALAHLPMTSAQDYVRWRLIGLGHIAEVAPESFHTEEYKTLMRGITTSRKLSPKANKDDTIEAFRSANALCPMGVIGAMPYLERKNPKRARGLLEQCLEEAPLSRSYADFEIGIEALKWTLKLDAKCRKPLLKFCLNWLFENGDPGLVPDDLLYFVETLANALAQEKNNQGRLFQSILRDIEPGTHRKDLAISILCRQDTRLCVDILRKPEKWGLSYSGDTTLLELQDLIEVNNCLAVRSWDADPAVSIEVFRVSAQYVMRIDDTRTKHGALANTALSVFQCSPLLTWEILKCNKDDFYMALGGITDLLNTYLARNQDSSNLFFRVRLESFLQQALEPIRDRDVSWGKSAVAAAFTWRDHLACPRVLRWPVMDQDWRKAFKSFFEPFRQDVLLKSLYGKTLFTICKLVARFDWTAFMTVMRDRSLSFVLIPNITQESITLPVLYDEGETMSLIEDVGRLCDLKRANRTTLGPKAALQATMASIIAYYGGNAVDVLRTLPKHAWIPCAGMLKHLLPEGTWSSDDLKSLFALFQDMLPAREAMNEFRIVLSWQYGDGNIEKELLDILIKKAKHITDVATVLQVAEFCARRDKASAQILSRYALQLAEAQDDCGAILECLSSPTVRIGAAKRLELLQQVQQEAVKLRSANLLSKVTRVEAFYNPAGALFTLARYPADQGDFDDICSSVIDSISISDTPYLEMLIHKAQSIEGIKSEWRDTLVYHLINKGISAGIDVPSELLQLVTDIEWQIRLVVVLAGRNNDQFVLLESVSEKLKSESVLDKKTRCYAILGDYYLQLERYDDAIVCFREVLAGAMEYEMSFLFLCDVLDVATKCVLLPERKAVQLATELNDCVQRAKFYKSYKDYIAPLQKEIAIFFCAMAFWPWQRERATKLLEDSATEIGRVMQSENYTLFAESGMMTSALRSALSGWTVETTVEFLSVFLENLSEASCMTVADNFVRCLCRSEHPKERPLEQWGINQERLEPGVCGVLECIIPYCSREGRAKASFAIGVSVWGMEDSVEYNWIKQSLETAMPGSKDLGFSLYRDAWLAYAVMSKSDEHIKVAHALSLEDEALSTAVPYLVILAVKKTPDKVGFLREMWQTVLSLEEYEPPSNSGRRRC